MAAQLGKRAKLPKLSIIPEKMGIHDFRATSHVTKFWRVPAKLPGAGNLAIRADQSYFVAQT